MWFMCLAYNIRRGFSVGLPVPATSFEKLGPMLAAKTFDYVLAACAKFSHIHILFWMLRWLVRAILCSYDRPSTSIDLPLPSRFHFHRPSTSILLPRISHPMEPHPRKQIAWVWLLRTTYETAQGGVVSTWTRN